VLGYNARALRVLITGGAGFIGSHVADAYLARGDEVAVLDNLSTGKDENVSLDCNWFAEGDVADSHFVEQEFASFHPEVVLHAAGSYADPSAWAEDARTNAVGTATVVQAAERHNVRRFVYLQTALCYGLHPESPVRPRRELDPSASSYAITKTAGEYFVRNSSLDWQSFRLANCYGPRNVSGPTPAFYKRLKAGQSVTVMDTRRDFVFIYDLVRLLVMALDGGGKARTIYHASSGSDQSIMEMYMAVEKAMNLSHAELPDLVARGPDDAPSILLDPEETEIDFGWTTSTSLELGVRAAVDYYNRHGVGATYTHLRLPAHGASQAS